MASSEYLWVVGGTPGLVHEKVLGIGGAGSVHQVQSPDQTTLIAQISDTGPTGAYPARVFARKILEKNSILSASKNEERAIKKLCNKTNENIIHVFRIGEFKHNGMLYTCIDTELCDFTLSEYIKWSPKIAKALHGPEMESPVSKKSTWNIMRQITSGLAFIHSQNEIHRDLKPQNGPLQNTT